MARSTKRSFEDLRSQAELGNEGGRTLHWEGDPFGALHLLDQTLLPIEERDIVCATVEDVWEAIKMLRVRGAPAIGVTAAYGVVVGMQPTMKSSPEKWRERLNEVCEYLASSRPTAVNLFWALDRMKRIGSGCTVDNVMPRLLEEARKIEHEDRDMCAAIGRHGAALLAEGKSYLTHCNAGSLATAGDGTALSVFYAAAAQGKNIHVYADETRPLLQGARLTSWELKQRNIPVTLLCDSMAGWMMKQGRIQGVITGADRIAANGDAANKIGTYSVAVLARAHDIPMYIAAPSSTFDFSLASGASIPIEERDPQEITNGFGKQTAPNGIAVANPAFDVTPAELITALITEQGVISPVTTENIARVLRDDAKGAP
ncbi:MAG: S-methyl-5-thioribose-1-phosphate isomerase [Planctomycetota bacterium]|nr:S-methyl-5-thioribose-1-phosphate isomerase [Planctomycetota bacterium]MDA1211243.1 S-methyl-5-thioribose-1-phosphate isomerase [Planctomycetota bacterium]